MRRFTCTTGGHFKFWEIERTDHVTNVRFGRIDTAGQTSRKEHATVDHAADFEREKIREKLDKGYVEDRATRPQTVPVECPRCSGTGRTIRDICAECGGTGRIPAWALERATREARDLGVAVDSQREQDRDRRRVELTGLIEDVRRTGAQVPFAAERELADLGGPATADVRERVQRLQQQVVGAVDRTRAGAAAGRTARPAPTVGGVPNEGMRHVCACGAYRMIWDVADARMIGAVQCLSCGTWEECNPGGRRFAAPAIANRCGSCAGRGGTAPTTRCLSCRGTGNRTTAPAAPTPAPARPAICSSCNGTGLIQVNRATEISCGACRGSGRTRPAAPAAPEPPPVRPAPLGEIRCMRCNHNASSHVIHTVDANGDRVLDQCLDCGRNQQCGDVAFERRQRARQPRQTFDPGQVRVTVGGRPITPTDRVEFRTPAPPRSAARRPIPAKPREQRRELDLEAIEPAAEKPAAPSVARRDLDLD